MKVNIGQISVSQLEVSVFRIYGWTVILCLKCHLIEVNNGAVSGEENQGFFLFFPNEKGQNLLKPMK